MQAISAVRIAEKALSTTAPIAVELSSTIGRIALTVMSTNQALHRRKKEIAKHQKGEGT